MSNQEDFPKPAVYIKKLTFNDGTSLEFAKDEVVIIVGANNVGKSACIREIHNELTKADAHTIHRISASFHHVVSNVQVDQENIDEQNVIKLLGSAYNEVHKSFKMCDNNEGGILCQSLSRPVRNPLYDHFCTLLDDKAKVKTLALGQSHNRGGRSLLGKLYDSKEKEDLIYDLSKQVFGSGPILDKLFGTTDMMKIMRWGIRPEPCRLEDEKFVAQVQKLPYLQDQGDGVQSFFALIGHLMVGTANLLLIDEPESHLHPPQCRHMGEILVKMKPKDSQLFIATHDVNILNGVFDAQSSKCRIIRIGRTGSKNVPCELPRENLTAILKDSVFRYSNVLEGLFYSRVILCESDRDIAAYKTIYQHMRESMLRENINVDHLPADVFFFGVGGKARMKMIAPSLREMKVCVGVLVDIDFVNDGTELERSLKALGALDSDTATATNKQKEMRDCLLDLELPNRNIKEPLKPEVIKKTWKRFKKVGEEYFGEVKDAVQQVELSEAYYEIKKILLKYKIYLVPYGELESVTANNSSKGILWFSKAVDNNPLETDIWNKTRDLLNDMFLSLNDVPQTKSDWSWMIPPKSTTTTTTITTATTVTSVPSSL